MISSDAMERENASDLNDVLTYREENVLSLIRDLVAGIRSRGMSANVETLNRALIAEGASRTGSMDETRSADFCLCGAHFSISVNQQYQETIQLSFKSL